MPSNVVFCPGQLLTNSDLCMFLNDCDGARTNAFEISYAIFDNTEGIEKLIGSPTRTPENPEVGQYCAIFRIPDFAPYGDYLIRWTFKQSAGGPDNQVTQEFGVLPLGTQFSEEQLFTGRQLAFIHSLRIMLRDNNPDRNYHFRPPASQDALDKQTRVFGYIWTDEEMAEAIERGLDMMNLYPPQTGFTLGTLPNNWRTLMLTGAAIHALTAIQLNWIVEEFGYSIGGVSLDIDKSQKYQSAASDLQSRFDKQLEDAHMTIKITKGIQQPRFGVGIRSAFGPHLGSGILSPRAFVRF